MGPDTRDRFRKLERPREATPGKVDPLAHDGRFEHVAGELSAPVRPAQGLKPAVERFVRASEPQLETAELPEDVQPFTRCAHCQTDNTLYAAACENCDAPLDTPEQRAFNAKLWAAHRAEANAERRDGSVEPTGVPGTGSEGDPESGAARSAVPGSALFARPWQVAVWGLGGLASLLLFFGHGRTRAAGAVFLLVAVGVLAPALWRSMSPSRE